MKDLIIVLITTTIIIGIWIKVEVHDITSKQMISDKLLEMSTPFNGRIDVEYLNNLSKSAYEN